MGTINAAALANSKERPSVTLPRWRWLPLIGPFLARVLPPKTHHGITLSYDEFVPFRDEWLRSWTETEGELDEKVFRGMVSRFLKAQRLPVKDIFALPGTPLQVVIEDLFLYQTRSNLPRQIYQTIKDNVMRTRTGSPSPQKGPRTTMGGSITRTPS